MKNAKKFTALILALAACMPITTATYPTTNCASALTIVASIKEATVRKSTIAVGESVPIEIEWTTGAKQELVFTSSDESVVTVDEKGVCTGIADGTAVITVAIKNGSSKKTIELTVSNDVQPSVIYNTSDFMKNFGVNMNATDVIHYDGKGLSRLNVVNSRGDFDDIVLYKDGDYVLESDTIMVGGYGWLYLAPEIDGVEYTDCRNLKVGDTIDRNSHLLCFDYTVNDMMIPIILSKEYEKYFGNGNLIVTDIDEKYKKIKVECDSSATYGLITIESKPRKLVYTVGEGIDLEGLTLSVDYFNGENHERLIDNTPIDYAKDIDIDFVDVNMTTPGNYPVKVVYNPKPEYKIPQLTTTFDIKVIPKAVVTLIGDANEDGEVNIADVLMLQRWLLGKGELTNWANVDLCKDGRIDVFDMIALRKEIVNVPSENQPLEVPESIEFTDNAVKLRTTTNANLETEVYTDLESFASHPDAEKYPQYDAEFFKNYSLICLRNQENSGSIEEKIYGVTRKSTGEYRISLRIYSPMLQTADMMAWEHFIAVPKNEITSVKVSVTKEYQKSYSAKSIQKHGTGVTSLPIAISTYDDMKAWIDKNIKDESDKSELEIYNEDFFKYSSLIVFSMSENSGGNEEKVVDVVTREGAGGKYDWYVKLEKISGMVPTNDMAHWYHFVKVDKEADKAGHIIVTYRNVVRE